MSLLAYACDDLLILYWERQEKMTPGLSIQVDEIELQKPILGAEWAEAPHYLLVAYCKGIARRNNPNIRILDALGQVQAETSAPNSPRSLRIGSPTRPCPPASVSKNSSCPASRSVFPNSKPPR